MKKIKLCIHFIVVALVANSTFAASAPIQQVSIINMLWNQNATGGVQGLTPTAINVSFNNGGSKPCHTATVAFQNTLTINVGNGQPCVNPVTSVSFAPVTGPAGSVYLPPSDEPINTAYFSTQMTVENEIDPVFNTTNAMVITAGTVKVTSQRQ